MAKPIEVFLSHSSEDTELANALVEAMHGAIDNLGRVRCTSAYGFGLDIGSKVSERLRKDIVDECDVFVFLASAASLSSQYCQWELGAAWGAKVEILPILAPNLDKAVLQLPLSSIQACQWTDEEGWIKLLSRVAKLTTSDLKDDHVVRRLVKKLARKNGKKKLARKRKKMNAALDFEKLIPAWQTLRAAAPVSHIESESDYEQATVFLNRLLDIVRDDATHPLYSLVGVVGDLIEAYEIDHEPV